MGIFHTIASTPLHLYVLALTGAAIVVSMGARSDFRMAAAVARRAADAERRAGVAARAAARKAETARKASAAESKRIER